MLLALDIGNTETTVGLFAGDRLEGHWRLHTTGQRTPDEWAARANRRPLDELVRTV